MKPVTIGVVAGVAGLGIGLTVGFGAGVLSTKAGSAAFERLTTLEQAPDVAHAQRLVKRGFSVSFPGNWHVKPPSSEKVDADHLVTLESRGGDASVVLILMDAATDAKANVDLQRRQLTAKVMQKATAKPFDGWGRYHGEGLELDGLLLGVTPGTARIFSTNDQGRSFIAVEIEGRSVRGIDFHDAFDLVERTFELAGPAAASPAP